MALIGEYRAGGFVGELVSLGGVKLTQGRGLKAISSYYVLAATESVQLLDPNPKRMWALITDNSLDWCRILFASTGAFAANGHRLDIGGSIIINKELPWIGAVVAYSPAGSGGCTITVTEVTADE
jgi:hypothetical protein